MKHASNPAQDNRANQLNPNNPAYWTSRGLPGVPEGASQQGPAPTPPNPAAPQPPTAPPTTPGAGRK